MVSMVASLSTSTYSVEASKFLLSKDPNFLKFSSITQGLINYEAMRARYKTMKT
jgi:hypothetical protein